MIQLKTIDSHIHFPFGEMPLKTKERKDMKENEWIKKDQKKWRLAWNFLPPENGFSKEDLIEKWYEETITKELDKVVFVTAGGNENAVEIISKHPDRFIAYAHHHPETPKSAEILEEYLKKGLKGYKILAPAIEKPISDSSFYPLWEILEKRELPLLIHFGILGGSGGIAWQKNINPLNIHDVAKNFPNLNIIIPHFGCGYVFETLNLCWACPNVSIDTSGSNQWMNWMPYEVSLNSLFKKYRETIGAERIIFGTDSSYFPRGFAKAYHEEQIRAMVYSGYSESEIEMVLSGNIKKILKI